MMPIPDLLTFLQGLPDLARRSQLGLRAADFTLDRMQTLMAALGQPQQQYRSIHVAGTNGKGSVCALCAAALLAEGYTVGLFTSPHIQGALHGIRIDGRVVPAAELQASFDVLFPHLEAQQGWTHFEVVTALMFLHFAQVKVDVAVIEVGLGGRLDATNVLRPTLAVITSIDYDHTAILGDTLAQIAGEKAGIIKPAVPVVIAPQAAEAEAVILARAKAQGAPVVKIGADLLFEQGKRDLQGQELRVWRPGEQPIAFSISLLGSYQVQNAATAYAALQVANENGIAISLKSIQKGFEAARWPGRFEILQTDPVLILDAAHSPAAAAGLRQSLDEYFPERRIILVLGVSADKNLEGLLAPLLPRVTQAIATQSPQARAMPAAQLAERLAALGVSASAEPDPQKAVAAALAQANGAFLVLVAGSVFLVETVREDLA